MNASTGITMAQATAACQSMSVTFAKLNIAVYRLTLMLLASDRPGWAKRLEEGNHKRFITAFDGD